MIQRDVEGPPGYCLRSEPTTSESQLLAEQVQAGGSGEAAVPEIKQQNTFT